MSLSCPHCENGPKNCRCELKRESIIRAIGRVAPIDTSIFNVEKSKKIVEAYKTAWPNLKEWKNGDTLIVQSQNSAFIGVDYAEQEETVMAFQLTKKENLIKSIKKVRSMLESNSTIDQHRLAKWLGEIESELGELDAYMVSGSDRSK